MFPVSLWLMAILIAVLGLILGGGIYSSPSALGKFCCAAWSLILSFFALLLISLAVQGGGTVEWHLSRTWHGAMSIVPENVHIDVRSEIPMSLFVLIFHLPVAGWFLGRWATQSADTSAQPYEALSSSR